jgi:2,5-diketo-D-gluconate reductase A
MSVPLLRLNNGVEMPALGFGVFQTPPDETTKAVEAALTAGYRHIDTAAAYGNEREVGAAIRRSGLDRSEVLIETKVWISDYGYDQTLQAFDKSAGKLGIDQIDLLILHQALPSEFDLTIAAYRALEKLLADGNVRAIGVSNFMPDHLARLMDATSVVPAVNQIEVHPYFRQSGLLAVDAEHGILSQAWSPIGGITRQPIPDRRELRRLRLRADGRPACRCGCARHWRARWPRTGTDHPRGIRKAHPRGLNSGDSRRRPLHTDSRS